MLVLTQNPPKQAIFLVTSTLIIETSMEIDHIVALNSEVLATFIQLLEHVPYINYLVQFKKDQDKVQALLNSSNEINVKSLAYITNLGLKVWSTNIKAQKADDSIFQTFEMALTSFQVKDKHEKAWFFQEIFLVADISMAVILSMSFLAFSNVDMLFVKQKLI